jgi:tetratricopeptide (TPR) repeat protein
MERKLNRTVPMELARLLNGLAGLMRRQGKLVEAEAALREALPLKIKVYGEEHFDVAVVLDNLGGVLVDQGRLAEAEPLLQQGLAMRRKLGGDLHPHVAVSLANLADLRERQGRLTEAESLLRQAVEIDRKLTGDDRPFAPELPGGTHLVNFLEHLSRVLQLQGKTAEAPTPLREALDLLRKPSSTGPPTPTPTVGRILHHLADALRAGQAYAEARPLAEEATGLYRLHPEWPAKERTHATTVLINVLMDVGDFATAESVCHDLLQDLRASTPPDSPELSGALAELALVLLDGRKFRDAEPLARECLESRERNIPDDWRTFNTRSLLGGSLLGQKRYSEAGPLLLAGYEGMKQREDQIPPQGKPRLKEALQRLVQFCEETKPEQAAEWKQKLAELDQARNQ